MAVSPHTSTGHRRALKPGTLVAGRFRVDRRIACGGMGEVWEGEHCELRFRVAIKTLRKDVASDRELSARFAREAFLLGRIQSQHVARVLDFVPDKRLGPILVMEFVEGTSLGELLDSKRLSVEEAIDLGIDIVSGLRELHRARVIHRDVKPANVILRPVEGARHRAVFVDLGVSRLLTDREEDVQDRITEITTCDRAVGTVEYMAPEQILSSRDVGASADLYAVGAILFRAVTGHHVFGDVRGADLFKCKLSNGAPPLQTGRVDFVAKGFEEVVARSLARAPQDRYEVADEMLAELLHLRDAARRASSGMRRLAPTNVVTATVPPRRPPPLPPHARKAPIPRWQQASLVAGGLIISLLVGLVVGTRVHRAPAVPTGVAASAQVGSRVNAHRCTLTLEPRPPGSMPANEPASFSIVCGDP
jgi:serine/threonine protein kinase